jgi:hypothetical protein
MHFIELTFVWGVTSLFVLDLFQPNGSLFLCLLQKGACPDCAVIQSLRRFPRFSFRLDNGYSLHLNIS